MGAIVENSPNSTYTTNEISETGLAAYIQTRCASVNAEELIEPYKVVTFHNSSTATRKMNVIDVKDYAKIYLSTSADRKDTEMPNAHRLTEILIKNYKNQIIKKVKLDHSYSTIKYPGQTNQNDLKKRLMLSKVHEIYGNDTLSYTFDYVQRPDSLKVLKRDYWGYVTTDPDIGYVGTYREANKTYCKIDALQKITLPTGGARIYDWESNTYSYIGDTRLEDFSDNPDNWDTLTEGYPGSTQSTTHALNYSAYDQTVNFNVTTEHNGGYSVHKQIYNGTWQKIFGGSGQPKVNGTHILEGGQHYRIEWGGGGGFDPNQGGGQIFGNCTVTYLFRSAIQKNWLYGGGVRIGRIGYFEKGDVPSQYYENVFYQDGFSPVKEKKYTYNFSDDNSRSSGSLAFAKPIFNYATQKDIEFVCADETGIPIQHYYQAHYVTTTDYNNLNPTKTHGSDVGYQNVHVSETGNGHTTNVYFSPIDYPEENYTFSYPFTPDTNVDYKRGHLIKELVYDENNKKLSETTNSYQIIEAETAITGMRVFSAKPCAFRSEIQNSSYSGYLSNITGCADGTNNNNFFCDNCHDAPYYIAYPLVREAFGWVRLNQTETKSFFYDNGGLGQPVVQKTFYEYNSDNKQISKQSTETYSSATIDKKDVYYNYFSGPANHISDIESIRTIENGHQLRTSVIRTLISGHIDFLPASIQEFKIGANAATNQESNNLYSITKYFRYYNEWGVPRVVQDAYYGKITNYVMGYNNTLVIAVIESRGTIEVSNSPLQPLIDAAVTESNNLVVDENLLRSKLQAIRDYVPTSMVTTFTHKPLVGITSTTDPKGLTTFYEYDAFNRLKNVKDSGMKLISENKYHYRPNN